MVNDLVVRNVADLAAVPTGKAGRPNNLVFCTSLGGPMYATDVRMEFKRITEVVYRLQFRPVTRTAAIALGPLFEGKGKSNGGQS
jgi:hypothetical protein